VCGRAFGAPIYRSANVTLDPGLKTAILGGSFNVVECPDCRRRTYADVPFLYHDMAAGLAVWVYPTTSAGQEPAIRAKIQRAAVILGASVGESLRTGTRPEDELLFGMERLIERLVEPIADGG
jgi:hypothetical protein